MNPDNPYSCKKCDKTYFHQPSLIIHQKIHEEKKYSCKLCTKKFYYSHHLQQHETTYNNEKTFGCNFCEKTFKHLSNANKHEKLRKAPATTQQSVYAQRQL